MKNKLYVKESHNSYRINTPVNLQDLCDITASIFEQQITNKVKIASANDIQKYLIAKLALEDREIFSCVFFDTKHEIIEYKSLFFGTVNGAVVYPREIVKAALACNASALILVHNHPSGDPRPSNADIQITEKIKNILEIIDVTVLDHIIVSFGKSLSFAEKGLI